MNDIDLAKEMLIKNQLALAVVKDGKLIFSSKDRGIKPLYKAVNEIKDSLKGASVADKVIGKAAAMLCEYAGIKELHANVISENAVKVLEKAPILYEYNICTPYIKNRDKTGMCPVEALSLKTDSTDELLNGILNFLKSINNI